MGTESPAASPDSTPEPKKFSDIFQSLPANLMPKPIDGSQNESAEKARMKSEIERRVRNTEDRLLRAAMPKVPKKFEGRASFDSLPGLVGASCKRALAYCKSWAQRPEGKAGPLLMGKSGTFKSHLMWAAADELHEITDRNLRAHANALISLAGVHIDSGKIAVAFNSIENESTWPARDIHVTDGAEIAHAVRSSIVAHNLDDVVAMYRQEGMTPDRAALFVDDVEVMKLSDWLHEELYRIFNYRYHHAMPTMISTNLSPDEMKKHLGDRIARRISDMTEPFRV